MVSLLFHRLPGVNAISKEVTGPNAMAKHSLLPDRQIESPTKRPKSAEGKTSANEQVKVRRTSEQSCVNVTGVVFRNCKKVCSAEQNTGALRLLLTSPMIIQKLTRLCVHLFYLFDFDVRIHVERRKYRRPVANQASFPS